VRPQRAVSVGGEGGGGQGGGGGGEFNVEQVYKHTNSYWTLEWIVKNGKDLTKCKCKFFSFFFAKHIILECQKTNQSSINKSSIQEMTESFL